MNPSGCKGRNTAQNLSKIVLILQEKR